MTNPVLPGAPQIQLVRPMPAEVPSLEVVLFLAKEEVRLSPNPLARSRALELEARLIAGLTALFTND